MSSLDFEQVKEATFAHRHIGPRDSDVKEMCKVVGVSSLEELVAKTIPESIRLDRPLNLGEPVTEARVLRELRKLASKNKVFRSFIGTGYYDCHTPSVIARNVLENPAWYTQYTPYQPEISQGRLEALLNFQTVITELTGLELANSSLLDEGTAAAEAMTFSYRVQGKTEKNKFFVSEFSHPHVIDVVKTRAEALGFEIVISDHMNVSLDDSFFGALLPYPASDGKVFNYESFVKAAKEKGVIITASADLLALTLLKPPGQWGADIVVGNTQRFGVGFGFGGPHAAYFACKKDHQRQMPGRMVGVSVDKTGKTAYRLALQTREQHIKRERATSNICTAQVLLAIMAGMYAVFHGPKGLKEIGLRVRTQALALARALTGLGFNIRHQDYFDTIRIDVPSAKLEEILKRADQARMSFRVFNDSSIGISLNERTTAEDLSRIVQIFDSKASLDEEIEISLENLDASYSPDLGRTSEFLKQKVFNTYHSETEILRYIYRLESRDLSLTTSMIPLGSCTMKLNATTEMLPVSWSEFSKIHPFAPKEQTEGYRQMISELEDQLAEITGFSAVSLQPNSGAQGEYAGLLVIRAFHHARGDIDRNVCLIPESAHGTNPASAALAGMKVVVVKCDDNGNVDIFDLEEKAEKHSKELSCLMITYPSTHGVFEEGIGKICSMIHKHGGKVYMDGANMNAQVGLCRPADFGADVCHLNLHKTFCIPHGGGGPGMGPICVSDDLAPFLPGHVDVDLGHEKATGAVSSAPWGSASILPIPYVYIRLMGSMGLKKATEIAILNANYIAKRLENHFPVLYKGRNGTVAHECILDLRNFKRSIGIEVGDIAKRLMDYGFHAPTVSFPVIETLMVEPTESESKEELDRFCDAMISIREEIREVEEGKIEAKDSVLKNAPHTAEVVTSDTWEYKYSREKAAYPAPWLKEHKFWPAVSRIDNAYGDRNLFCSCIS